MKLIYVLVDTLYKGDDEGVQGKGDFLPTETIVDSWKFKLTENHPYLF